METNTNSLCINRSLAMSKNNNSILKFVSTPLHHITMIVGKKNAYTAPQIIIDCPTSKPLSPACIFIELVQKTAKRPM